MSHNEELTFDIVSEISCFTHLRVYTSPVSHFCTCIISLLICKSDFHKMDAVRSFFGWTLLPKSAPSSRKDDQTPVAIFAVKTAVAASSKIQQNTAGSMTTSKNITDNHESSDVEYRKSVAFWVAENEYHGLPERGFYGCDEYMESFNDNWILDDMVFSTFYYPTVPANKAQQPRGEATAELLWHTESESSDDSDSENESTRNPGMRFDCLPEKYVALQTTKDGFLVVGLMAQGLTSRQCR